ncbi:MAG TPA: crossover junction endodeoxyribonuclease RuvC [Gemmatales bacterium]|nr:crossover junction endodeoxyribonuclease RuvC [Gemmatales bacterium]HMP60312.1 crossover junction endodeoxyribonuclease RuvC [Gemmatales bacterium]
MAAAPRILGIDPGLHVAGYAVLAGPARGPELLEAGVIRSAGTTMPERLLSLYRGVGEVIAQFQPQVMAVEELYAHYDHPRTAILMGHARGVFLLAAAAAGLETAAYAATEVKKLIAGHGRATKEQMQLVIQREFHLATPPDPPDVADAIAVALCHWHRQGQAEGSPLLDD